MRKAYTLMLNEGITAKENMFAFHPEGPPNRPWPSSFPPPNYHRSSTQPNLAHPTVEQTYQWAGLDVLRHPTPRKVNPRTQQFRRRRVLVLNLGQTIHDKEVTMI